MDKLEKILQGIRNLEAAVAELSSNELLPGFSFKFALHDKVVIDNGDSIIRVSPRADGLLRIGVQQFFAD